MKIHHLQITNFKSYLGHHIIGPFHPHFTCVIGPNGNGKSNILDAMLFVFGFKSAKLRQDSLPSLIHSSAYGQPDQAKVTVKFIENNTTNKHPSHHLSQPSQQLPQPSYLTVSRTIRKNGHCFYQLNDKKVPWQQLRDLLMRKDIDLQKNLFIILQGQVERLCELSPQKLVEYMEYVSGSDQFVPKIMELEQEYVLEGVKHEQAKQKHHIIKKVYTQQQKQTFQLLQHIGLRIKLLELSFLFAKKRQQLASKSLSTHKSSLQTISESLQRLNTNLQSLLTKKQNYHKALNANSTAIESLDKQVSKLIKEFTNLEDVQMKKKQTELEYLVRDLKQKQKETDFVEKEQKELAKIASNQQLLKKQSAQMEQLINQVLQKVNEANQSQKSESQLLTVSKQKSNKKLPSTNKTYQQIRTITKLQQQLNQTQTHIQTLTHKLHQQQTKLQQSQLKFKNIIDKYGKNGQKFVSNQESTMKLKLKIKNFTTAIQQKQHQLSVIVSNIEQLQRRIHDSESTKITLTNQQKVLNQIKSANRANLLLAHRQLTTLRQQLLLPINYASIINVITPQLDFLIVQNHEQATQIIRFLNARKIGRMSFILKDQVLKLMNGISTDWNKTAIPKTCERIYDIVRPIDKEYDKLWFWAVGNTLIAQTLEDAMKVAYYNSTHYRVITKNGEFIDLSGAMTKLPISNKSSEIQDRTLLQTRLKVLQNKADEDTRKITAAKKQTQQLTHQLHELNSTIQEFPTITHLKQHIMAIQNDLGSATKQVIHIQGQIASHQLSIKLKQREINSISEGINYNEGECRISLEQLVELVVEYQNLMGKIKKIEISESLIKMHKEKVQKYRKEMYAIDQKIVVQKQSIQEMLKQIKENKLKISEIESRKKSLRSQISQTEQQLFLLDLDIKQLKGENQPINASRQLKGENKPINVSRQQIESISMIGRKQQQQKNKQRLKNQQKEQQMNRKSQPIQQLNFLGSQQYSLQQLVKQEKTLSEQIGKLTTQVKSLNLLQETQLGTLSRLFTFLVEKCQQVQGSSLLLQQQKLEAQHITKPSTTTNKQQTFQQMLQRQHKKVVTFKDILFEYFHCHNLISSLQKTIKPAKSSQQHSFLLANLCQHCLQQQLAPLSKIVSLCYFNNWKIMNISAEDQYFFAHFLSKTQIQTLVQHLPHPNNYYHNISKTPSKQSSSQSQPSHQQSSPLNQQSSKQHSQPNPSANSQNPQRPDLFLLQHLTLDRIKFLYQLNLQKLHSLQNHSLSIFIKSAKKQNLNLLPNSNHKNLHDSLTQTIDPQNPSLPLSFFTDPFSPLDPHELQIITQYQTQKIHFTQLQTYLHSVQTNLQSIYKQLLALRQSRNTCFLQTFNLINIQVNKIYHFLTKGNAQINLLNSINPLEGLQFSVRPFNKSWKSVNLLSGGQKTLTSLSLIFACQQVRKFPFYFMDEIDAALDYKNVTNLGKYITQKQQVQHIVISLRKNMYEQCNSLVCIYKVNDVSRTMTVYMKTLYQDRKSTEHKKTESNSQNKTSGQTNQEQQTQNQRLSKRQNNKQTKNQQLSQTSTITIKSK